MENQGGRRGWSLLGSKGRNERAVESVKEVIDALKKMKGIKQQVYMVLHSKCSNVVALVYSVY